MRKRVIWIILEAIGVRSTLYTSRNLFPKNYSGTVIGLWTLYHGLGSIISPVLSGWIIDATGTYVWAFILAMSCSILSLLLLLPITKTDSVGILN